MILKGSIWQGS